MCKVRVYEKVWGKGGGELNKHKQQILKTFIRTGMFKKNKTLVLQNTRM